MCELQSPKWLPESSFLARWGQTGLERGQTGPSGPLHSTDKGGRVRGGTETAAHLRCLTLGCRGDRREGPRVHRKVTSRAVRVTMVFIPCHHGHAATVHQVPPRGQTTEALTLGCEILPFHRVPCQEWAFSSLCLRVPPAEEDAHVALNSLEPERLVSKAL